MTAQPQTQAARPAAASSMRTGAEYLRSLDDGRQVFVDGEKVKDVTTHRAYREAARSIARLTAMPTCGRGGCSRRPGRNRRSA